MDTHQSSPSPPLRFPELSMSRCCFRWLFAVTSLRISWDPQRVAARTGGRAAILARDGVLTLWRCAG